MSTSRIHCELASEHSHLQSKHLQSKCCKYVFPPSSALQSSLVRMLQAPIKRWLECFWIARICVGPKWIASICVPHCVCPNITVITAVSPNNKGHQRGLEFGASVQESLMQCFWGSLTIVCNNILWSSDAMFAMYRSSLVGKHKVFNQDQVTGMQHTFYSKRVQTHKKDQWLVRILAIPPSFPLSLSASPTLHPSIARSLQSCLFYSVCTLR